MPVNEIHAPIYIKGKYSTPVYSSGHAFRLYFAAGCTWSVGASGDEDNWRLMEGTTDHGPVSGLIHDLFSRVDASLPANSHILEIELWHSVPGAPNVLDHLNTLPSGNTFGTGAGVAAAESIYVYGGALRQYYKLYLFDGGFVAPQRFAGHVPTTADDGTLAWAFLKSGIPYATNDGIRLSREVSENTGYNRKLARRYGRSITP